MTKKSKRYLGVVPHDDKGMPVEVEAELLREMHVQVLGAANVINKLKTRLIVLLEENASLKEVIAAQRELLHAMCAEGKTRNKRRLSLPDEKACASLMGKSFREGETTRTRLLAKPPLSFRMI